MNARQMCVSNVSYKRASASESSRARGLLGYLTYRESRDQGAKMTAGVERWADHGMGHSVAEIARRCEDLRSQHVLTFSLVINPNPQLIALIDSQEREQFVRELTERILDDFFEMRGIDTGCEYSYVLHHRVTDDAVAPGMHNPHTHVVLPGTVWSEEQAARIPLYFSQNAKVDHIAMLHTVTEQNMALLMERYVGLEWEQRIDTLEAVREAQRKAAVQTMPDARVPDAQNPDVSYRMWCGIRQTDEKTTAVGYYAAIPDPQDPDYVNYTFQPLVSGLPNAMAPVIAKVMRDDMDGSVERMRAFANHVNLIGLEHWQQEARDMKDPYDRDRRLYASRGGDEPSRASRDRDRNLDRDEPSRPFNISR